MALNNNQPDNILSAYGTLGHLLATVGAGTHVATLQHHAVDLGDGDGLNHV